MATNDPWQIVSSEPDTPTEGSSDPWKVVSSQADKPGSKPKYDNNYLVSHAADMAEKYGHRPDVFVSLIKQESSFNPDALSPTGVKGISQMTLRTGKPYGINNNEDRADPAKMLEAGAAHFADLLKTHNGNYGKAIFAYNGGSDPQFEINVGRHLPWARKQLASRKAAQADPWKVVSSEQDPETMTVADIISRGSAGMSPQEQEQYLGQDMGINVGEGELAKGLVAQQEQQRPPLERAYKSQFVPGEGDQPAGDATSQTLAQFSGPAGDMVGTAINVPFIPLEAGIKKVSDSLLRPAMEYAFPKATKEEFDMVQRGFEFASFFGFAPGYIKALQTVGKVAAVDELLLGGKMALQDMRNWAYRNAPDVFFKGGAKGGFPAVVSDAELLKWWDGLGEYEKTLAKRESGAITRAFRERAFAEHPDIIGQPKTVPPVAGPVGVPPETLPKTPEPLPVEAKVLPKPEKGIPITPDMTFTKVEAVPKATEAPAEARPAMPAETGQGKAETGINRAEFLKEPLTRVVGEDFSDTFFHGTKAKNIKTLAALERPVDSKKTRSKNDLLNRMFPPEVNEFGARMLLSEPRQAHQAVTFASGPDETMAVVKIKSGTKVLDLSDEATRRGSAEGYLKFFRKPAINEDYTNWYLNQVSDGYKKRHPDWQAKIATQMDPTSPEFFVDLWKDNLAKYAKERGYGLIRFADEVLVLDRDVIDSSRPATKAEWDKAKHSREYVPESKTSTLFYDKPTGAYEETWNIRKAEVAPAAPEKSPELKSIQEEIVDFKPTWENLRKQAQYKSTNGEELVFVHKSTKQPDFMQATIFDNAGALRDHQIPNDVDVQEYLRKEGYIPADYQKIRITGGLGKPSENYGGFGWKPVTPTLTQVWYGPKEHSGWMKARLESGGYSAEIEDVSPTERLKPFKATEKPPTTPAPEAGVAPAVEGRGMEGATISKGESLSWEQSGFRWVDDHKQISITLRKDGKYLGDSTLTIAPDGTAKVGFAKGEGMSVGEWKKLITELKNKYGIKKFYGDRIGERMSRPAPAPAKAKEAWEDMPTPKEAKISTYGTVEVKGQIAYKIGRTDRKAMSAARQAGYVPVGGGSSYEYWTRGEPKKFRNLNDALPLATEFSIEPGKEGTRWRLFNNRGEIWSEIRETQNIEAARAEMIRRGKKERETFLPTPGLAAKGKGGKGAAAAPQFIDYQDVTNWIEQKAKEYGGRNKFLASEEYHKIYPTIKNIAESYRYEKSKEAQKAMREASVKYGDKVDYAVPQPFGGVTIFEGALIDKGGMPRVQLTESAPDGRKSVMWHKGWQKVKAALVEGAPAEGKTPETKPAGPRKRPVRSHETAIAHNNLASLVMLEGGFDPKSYFFKGLNKGQLRTLQLSVFKKGGFAPDVLFPELKANYPDQFGHFENADDMVSAFLDGRAKRALNKKGIQTDVEWYNDLIQQEADKYGITTEELTELDRTDKGAQALEKAIERGELGLQVTPEQIRKIWPDISPAQAEILSKDPELRKQFAKGNWDAIARVSAAGKVSDVGAQAGLPGTATGLFAEPATPPKAEGKGVGEEVGKTVAPEIAGNEDTIKHLYSGLPVGPETIKLWKKVSKSLKGSPYFKDLSTDEMSLVASYLELPFWRAQENKDFAKVYEVQTTRENLRNWANDELLGEIEPGIRWWKGIPEATRQQFRDVVWHFDGIRKEPTDAQLQGFGLDAPAIETYRKLREVMDYIWDEDLTYLLGNLGMPKNDIDKLRRERGKVGGFFPHLREGKYYIYAKTPGGAWAARATKEGKPVIYKSEVTAQAAADFLNKKKPEGSARAVKTEGGWTLEYMQKPKTQYFELFDDIIASLTGGKIAPKAGLKERELKGKFPKSLTGVGKTKRMPEEVFWRVDTNNMQAVIDAAVGQAELPEGVGIGELRQALLTAVARTLQARGFGEHFIPRKDVPGFDKSDPIKAVIRFVQSYNGFKTKLVAARDFSQSMKGIDPKSRDWKYANKYVRDMLANAEAMDKVSDKLRAGFFFYFLGGVARQIVLQPTQNFVAFVPAIQQYTKWSAAKITAEMALAGKDIVENLGRWAIGKPSNIVEKRLGEDVWAGMEVARKKGVLADQLTREYGAYLLTNLGRLGRGLAKVGQFFIGNAEIFNRHTAYKVAYDVARGELKKTHLESMKFAEKMVEMAHFRYGKANLPPIFRGGEAAKIARSSYAFRSYNANLLRLYAHLGTGGTGKAGKAFGKEARQGQKGVFKGLLGLLAFGGLSSLWGYKFLEEQIQKKYGVNLRSELTKTLGEWSNLVKYGLPALVGIDLSGSLGMESPQSVGDIIGVPYTLYETPKQAIEKARKGDWYRAGEVLAPSVLKGPMKAYRGYTEGFTTGRGKDIKGAEGEKQKFTPYEAGVRSLSFRTTKEAEMQRRFEAQKIGKEDWTERRQDLVDAYRIALKRHGAGSPEVTAVVKQHFEFNKDRTEFKAPTGVSPITAETRRRAQREKEGKEQRKMRQAYP